MRKNGNTKSRVVDALVICACLLGTAAFLLLFYRDLNRSLRRLDEQPVGVIASSSRAALRRFQDRVLWDRLQKESPVYNGDFIRTAEHSQTVLAFSGGELVGISENSLVRIFDGAEGPRIDFARGNISVYAGSGEGLVVSFGENRIQAAAGSVLNLDAGTGEERGFSLRVIEGEASFAGPAGERELPAGTALSLGAEGTEIVETLTAVPEQPDFFLVPPDAPAPVSPAPEAVYYYQSDPPELRFQWSAAEEVLHYVLEAADNPEMANPVLRTEVRFNSLVYSELAEGRWYWRVRPVFPALYRGTAPASPAVPFSVVQSDPPTRFAEAPETEAPPVASPPSASPPSAAPPVVPAPPVVSTPAVSTPAVSTPAVSTPAVSTPPSPAPTPAAPRPPSPANPPPPDPLPPADTLLPAVPPPFPAVSGRRPENGYVIRAETLRESRTVVFSWNPVAGADLYSFTLFYETESGPRRSIVGFEGPETSYTLEDLSLLDTGRFVWRVEALGRGAEARRGTPAENRFIVDIPQPDIPRPRSPETLYGR
ncbi:MAG: hypothetical protein LBH35_11050 [Treponema sp.]|jgi:hypothetical protein|nr:hypothetical protein [Treponema sp.]